MVTTGALRLPIGLVVVLSVMHVTRVSCHSGFPDDSGSSSLVAGGCAKAQLCCHGKNHTCGVTETLTNVVVVTMATKCFCDSECLLNRDCCHDYRDYCQPVDCVVEKKWRKWSHCSVRCGIGTRNRTRSVLRSALHGGRECPSTLEVGSCEGTDCVIGGLRYRTMTSSDEMKMKETEVAWLLPMAFARWRTDVSYSRKQSTDGFELRRSEDGTDSETLETNTEYSAIYRLTEIGRGCNLQPSEITTPSSSWVTRVTSGTTVCVECQPTAVKHSLGGRCQGDGTAKMETRWAAVTMPGCHGKWVMVGKAERHGVCAETQKDSQGTTGNSLNFIFV